jgi:sulfur carrier protein
MIYINDNAHPIEQPGSLTDLLLNLKIMPDKGVAIALNNKVIPRSEWTNIIVNNNDRIILIKATQGG